MLKISITIKKFQNKVKTWSPVHRALLGLLVPLSDGEGGIQQEDALAPGTLKLRVCYFWREGEPERYPEY